MGKAGQTDHLANRDRIETTNNHGLNQQVGVDCEVNT